jgi:hypothetical protein
MSIYTLALDVSRWGDPDGVDVFNVTFDPEHVAYLVSSESAGHAVAADHTMLTAEHVVLGIESCGWCIEPASLDRLFDLDVGVAAKYGEPLVVGVEQFGIIGVTSRAGEVLGLLHPPGGFAWSQHYVPRAGPSALLPDPVERCRSTGAAILEACAPWSVAAGKIRPVDPVAARAVTELFADLALADRPEFGLAIRAIQQFALAASDPTAVLDRAAAVALLDHRTGRHRPTLSLALGSLRHLGRGLAGVHRTAAATQGRLAAGGMAPVDRAAVCVL